MHPVISCIPLLAAYSENSSEPNKLPESVIATAGILFRKQRPISSSILTELSSKE
ncbi:hypothetical protein CCY16_00027 [Wolbachia endosymbiont of Wuchereria bancrofti]|nr:hypothetical protein CCY16_00027 [Wolbachia endosymbiont of Wuchereria bancrofti]